MVGSKAYLGAPGNRSNILLPTTRALHIEASTAPMTRMAILSPDIFELIRSCQNLLWEMIAFGKYRNEKTLFRETWQGHTYIQSMEEYLSGVVSYMDRLVVQFHCNSLQVSSSGLLRSTVRKAQQAPHCDAGQLQVEAERSPASEILQPAELGKA